MFGLFDTKKVDDFARSLAQDLARRFPPASEARTDKGAVNQLAVVTEGLYARAMRFHQENRLGLYRKAKLGTYSAGNSRNSVTARTSSTT